MSRLPTGDGAIPVPAALPIDGGSNKAAPTRRHELLNIRVSPTSCHLTLLQSVPSSLRSSECWINLPRHAASEIASQVSLSYSHVGLETLRKKVRLSLLPSFATGQIHFLPSPHPRHMTRKESEDRENQPPKPLSRLTGNPCNFACIAPFAFHFVR
jgi:hypothetical protein